MIILFSLELIVW